MSIPKNHHYISQSHIKNFFNNHDEAIYLYDKESKRLFSKNTTKSIFSERNLNTKRNDDGTYDYCSIETELGKHFETDFPHWCEIVRNFIISEELDSEPTRNALQSLARYGLIAESRTPRNKKTIDEAMYKCLVEIFRDGLKSLPDELAKFFEFNEDVKYTNTGSYVEFANEVFEVMGELCFSIHIPKDKDDYFILPDFGAVRLRARINDHFNPYAKDIAYIGLPLSSKIYIHFFSGKLKVFPVKPGIHYRTSEEVELLNKANIEYAKQFIACEHSEYLKRFTADI